MGLLVDLHAHTTASDGALTPTELVELAAGLKLAAVAVTDHDTVAGVGEALAAGQGRDLEVIPGVEFSVIFDAPGYMHLLGLYIDPAEPRLLQALDRVSGGRDERNAKIIASLNDLGLTIDPEEVAAISQGGNTGRPHIGQALVNRGYVADLNESMSRYLKKGAPAYHDRFKLTAEAAIDLVHGAGGLAVIAHPASLEAKGAKLRAMLERLQAAGLDGLEAFCPTHSPQFRLEVEALARDMGLLLTGGSDFHGQYKPDIQLGTGRGDLRVGLELLEALKQELAGRGESF